MSVVRAQMTFQRDNGLPRDAVVNTFHFIAGTPPTNGQLDDIAARLGAFYNAIPAGGTAPIRTYLSPELNQNLTRVRMYNIDDPMPRTPIRDQAITIGALGSDALPGEVAVVLSFQGLPISGISQRNRRGRIYFGPCATNIGAGNPYTIQAPSLPNFVEAMRALAGGNADPTAAKWAVYSPTLLSAVDVRSGWVDNAFDVQRRRGIAPSSRTSWSI